MVVSKIMSWTSVLPSRLDGSVPPLPILLAGLAAGTVFGLFGAGGSAFATPMLALIGAAGRDGRGDAAARHAPGVDRRCSALPSLGQPRPPHRHAGHRGWLPGHDPRCPGIVHRRWRVAHRPVRDASRRGGRPRAPPRSGRPRRSLRRAPARAHHRGRRAGVRRRHAHRAARQRRRLPARPRLRDPARAEHGHGIGHEHGRGRRAGDADAPRPLAARAHRLARRSPVRDRRRSPAPLPVLRPPSTYPADVARRSLRRAARGLLGVVPPPSGL